MTERWQRDVAALLQPARTDKNAVGADAMREAGSDDVALAGRIVALALMGLMLGGREPPEEPAAGLFAFACDVVKRLPGHGTAYLAAGFAALGAGNAVDARRLLATASWLCEEERSGPRAMPQKMAPALALARVFLFDMPTPPPGAGVAPLIDDRLLKVAHARTLRSQGNILAALDLYDDAASGFVVRHPPISYDIYKGYKIVVHEGRYYAVPGTVHEFTIVDGIVCRPSRVVQYARLRMPRWAVAWLRRLGSRGGKVLWSALRRARLRLYAVRGVEIADDLEELLAAIDSSSRRVSNP
jgi:hypothetical protein